MALRCVERLIEEHRKVEAVLGELEAVVDEFLTSTDVSAESLQTLAGIGEFLSRDLVRHIQKEDTALFPALAKYLPAETGPVAVMLEEHAQITESFRGLLEGLAHLNGCPTVGSFGANEVRDHGRALIQSLRGHVDMEEGELFPVAESHFSVWDDSQILQKFDDIDARLPRVAPARLSG